MSKYSDSFVNKYFQIFLVLLSEILVTILRVDLIIAGLENRRNSILREIDRHRESLARRLRQNLEQIEDADYKVVNNKRPKD